MSKIEIEIVDDNPFNEGWLKYLLGMDRPDDDDASPAANGWDMGLNTNLKPIRHVFTRQVDLDKPQYVVRMVEPKVTKTKVIEGDFTLETAADGQKVITPHAG